jgi:chemotaxis protein methyltransferase CheR
MFSITSKEFKQFSDYIRINYGINLGEEKKELVARKLKGLVIQNNFENFSDYYNYIISGKCRDSVESLLNRITTNHTFFMREATHLYYFRDKVLPYLTSVIKDKDLRVWSAGCSTGEEAYILAMFIDEYFKKDKALWDTSILATDISSRVLEIAIKGKYSYEEILSLPPKWQKNYFKKIGNLNYIITDRIRNEVIFRKFNLIEEKFPFRRKFHVIFCRNVMIYFDAETKAKLVNKFYNSMEYGGYLFIGLAESLNRNETNFKYIMPSVYRKI